MLYNFNWTRAEFWVLLNLLSLAVGSSAARRKLADQKDLDNYQRLADDEEQKARRLFLLSVRQEAIVGIVRAGHSPAAQATHLENVLARQGSGTSA